MKTVFFRLQSTLCEKKKNKNHTHIKMKATTAEEEAERKTKEMKKGEDSKMVQREKGRRRLYTLICTSYRI